MLCIRDIFWQTFWRSEYFKKNKLAFALDGKISWQNLVKRPGMQDLLFCYKEPFLCFAVEHFASHFPHSRFIHIIRDGRDNADSMSRTYGDALSDEVLTSELLSLNKVSEVGFYERVDGFNYPYWIKADERPGFRGLSTYGRYVRLWREMTERALGLRSLVPTNRYLELRYEDVVRNPSIEGMRIKDFLGRPASSGFSRALDRAFSTSIGVAGKNQDAEKLKQATNIAGPLLESLRYEC
jgi:hypothetical protein